MDRQRQQRISLGLLTILMLLVLMYGTTPAKAAFFFDTTGGLGSESAITPGMGTPMPCPHGMGTRMPCPTGTGTPMPCPTGMGTCSPGEMAPAQLVQDGHYSDERFIDMMVPHHLLAIQMAQLAQQHADHNAIKHLATTIITTQNQEIAALKTLRQQLSGSAQTPRMMNPQQMENMGIMMPDQLAQQHPLDPAFLDAMIAHHASAIQMASVAIQRSQNPEIQRIARAIITTQSQEIGQMMQWRQAWYPV